ncbi:MAG: ATP-binding protein [Defluviitaleaceae bacterium]|nr:ATP-binding protein [Defluviitaleaceae bacterium]
MAAVKKLLRKVLTTGLPYIQTLFVFVAFGLMIFVTCIFLASNRESSLTELLAFLIMLGAVLAGLLSVILARIVSERNMAEKRMQIMLDSSPFGIHFLDDNYNVIDCNQAALDLFGLKTKEDYKSGFLSFLPERQPGGELSLELRNKYLNAAFEGSGGRYEWVFVKQNGEQLPCEVTLNRSSYKKRNVVIVYLQDLRELKKAIADIKRADEYTHLIFDSPPVSCTLWDEDSKIVNCNPEAFSLFGVGSIGELNLRLFTELSPQYQPNGLGSFDYGKECLRKTFAEGSFRTEFMHISQNGEPMPCDVSFVRVRHKDRYLIAGYTRDLREYKANMRALDGRLRQQALMTKISNTFLNNAYAESLFAETLQMVGEFMDIAQILLYRIDDANKPIVCRSEWIKSDLFVDSRIGAEFEADAMTIIGMIEARKASGNDVCLHSDDVSVKNAIGKNRNRFQNFVIVPVFVKGKLGALLDFSRDDETSSWSGSDINLASLVSNVLASVYERDAMERQFSIVENSPNPIFYLSSDASVEYVNPAAYRITGYTKDEIQEGGLGFVFGEQIFKEIKEKHIPDALRGEQVVIETAIKRKDGVRHVLMLSIVPTGNNSFSVISSDMTKIRELENDLIEAKEIAEHSSRAKSEFLSRMSHEMRTPMNTIIGMIQVLKLKDIPDGVAEKFSKIDMATQHLLKLINDILDVTGMEYGNIKLADSKFRMDSLFGETLQTARYNALSKNQKFTSDLDPSIPSSAFGDERQIKKVLVNLLANAVKFTPEYGSVDLKVAKTEESDETFTLMFTVADNGIGIPEEKQRNLFTIFEQADGSATRKHGGIGIGLALSKKIVEMMDGRIWVDSSLGKGAVFNFTCKLRKVN